MLTDEGSCHMSAPLSAAVSSPAAFAAILHSLREHLPLHWHRSGCWTSHQLVLLVTKSSIWDIS